MAYSAIEQRYVDLLITAAFPDAVSEPKPMAEEPSLDGLQIAAGPNATRTDAPQGYGEIRAVQPTKLESALQTAGVTLEQIGRFVDSLGQVEVPGLGEISLADLMPFVGSAKPGTRSVMGQPDWQGTPMALQAPADGKPLVTGKGQTLQLSPDAKLAAFDALPLAQGAKTAAGLTKKGAQSLAPTAGKMAEDYLRKTGGLMDVVPEGQFIRRDDFTAYMNQPKQLQGFRASGPNKSFSEQSYKHAEFLEIKLDDGSTFYDAIRGLNRAHAMSRAFGNWPTADEIKIISRDQAQKIDADLVKEVDRAMRLKEKK